MEFALTMSILIGLESFFMKAQPCSIEKIMQGIARMANFYSLYNKCTCINNSSDGRVVRASAFKAVDSGLITSCEIGHLHT